MSKRTRSYCAMLAASFGLLLGPLASPASAAVVFSERFDLTSVNFSTCNGEAVTLEGFVQAVVKEETDGTFSVTASGHAAGTGNQGNEYVLKFTQKNTSSVAEFHLTYREILVSKGSAPNQVFMFTFDFPPGDFTAGIDCRG